MNETIASKIAWHRRGPGPTYVGAASRGPEAVRLTGRDPVSGIHVALSIPIDAIEHVEVTERAGTPVDDDPRVVIDLTGSEPIELRPVGSAAPHAHLLARALGLIPAWPALVQGGQT